MKSVATMLFSVLWAVNIALSIALAFFSPGLDSEGLLGIAYIVMASAIWLWLLRNVIKSKTNKPLLIIQTILIALVLIETIGDAPLYIGT